MSYMMKGESSPQSLENKLINPSDQISKVPASDQEDVKNLKKGLGNLAGGAMQNPLGENAGEAADSLTSPLTGRYSVFVC